ncbi:MAG TPA: MBL fold metallo-hydrolase [Pseudonocardiaceae bacterium]|nr:MBL fold metallo-hydrolase [Pseudonocardiaceae bacterium]
MPEFTIVGTEQHAAWQRRVMPPVEKLPAGLWSIPVPFPDSPLRYTSCYVIPGDDGVVVVDPGWDSAEGWMALLGGLATAGVRPAEVVGIVATHVHPDHHGMSGRLRAESGAWVAMHPAEQASLPSRLAAEGRPNRRAAMVELVRTSGAPADECAAVAARFDERAASRMAAMIEPDVLLEDDDPLPLRGRQVRAVWTPGHTPGHLCLREVDARLLLTGDHVLPRITPNISVQPNLTDPLRHFLASLRKVGVYDDHDALPAHEYRFHGLASRTGRLLDHHARRCEELLAVVAQIGTPTLWQLAEHLTWSRPWAEVGRMRPNAIAETAAHADYLAHQGRLAWLTGSDQPVRLRLPRDN